MVNKGAGLKIVFGSAEAAPIARVGGLAEATAGLIRSLRSNGDVEVIVVLPDYGGVVLEDEQHRELSLPEWAMPASVRTGKAPELGVVHLVSAPGIARPHPYVDETGAGWPDNDARFFAFSAAIAAIVDDEKPDVLHLNDWHTGMALAWVDVPSVYTIHTLGYQGHADIGWLRAINTDRATAFDRFGVLNPAAGAIALADRVIAVSPNYATEILDPTRSAGLHTVLDAKGDGLIGIRNGIDTTLWNPLTDPYIVDTYGRSTLDAKASTSARRHERVGWAHDGQPLIGMVTRLVEQKGIDMILQAIPELIEHSDARFVLIGSGNSNNEQWMSWLAQQYPDRVGVYVGYNEALAHLLEAGCDLFIMPSRFEPCGLNQMYSLQYGTLPVVYHTGGLADTVVNAIDVNIAAGTANGFVFYTPETAALSGTIHWALQQYRDQAHWQQLQNNAMRTDFGWQRSAEAYLRVYSAVHK